MPQLADRLQNMTQELSWPVSDATGLEGGWDFTLTFSRNAGMIGGGRGGEVGRAEGAMPSAMEPTGALTLFEAVEKQLALKLNSEAVDARYRDRSPRAAADRQLIWQMPFRHRMFCAPKERHLTNHLR